MIPARLFSVLAAVVGVLPLACAHAAPPPRVMAEQDPVIVTGDVPGGVPLLAPDEPVDRPPSRRLSATRTLGRGEDQSYLDGARRADRSTTAFPLPPEAPPLGPGIARGGHYGGYYRGASFPGGASPASPAVGGNFPAVRSFGPRAAR